MYWRIPVFQAFVSADEKTKARGTLPCPHWQREKKAKRLPPFPSLAVMCDTQLGRSPSCSPLGSAYVTHLYSRKHSVCRAKAGAWMEGTLTRFSPEPRAAVHLPLQSGASVRQGDSDETTDRRGDEKDWFPGREHFDWERRLLWLLLGVFQN